MRPPVAEPEAPLVDMPSIQQVPKPVTPPSAPAARAKERGGPSLSLDELERSLVTGVKKPAVSRPSAPARDVSAIFSDLVTPQRGRPAPASPTAPPRPVETMAEAGVSAEVPVEPPPAAAPAGPVVPPPAEAPPAPVAPARKAEPPREELVEISSFAGPPLDDLQQIDFFIQQELFDDALRLVDRLMQEYPSDAELAERRLTLKAKGVLVDEVTETGEAPDDLFAEEEQFFDLAKELEQELAEEDAMVAEATGRGKGEAELEEVFKEFQKGVAEQISEEDSATHFNLGIAYREMGLLPEAIREFQISSRDPRLLVDSCSMIGVCYTDQGMGESAAEWYRRALDAPELTADQRLGLRYELGSALESAGDIDQAAEVFEELVAAQPTYRDVSARFAVLSQQRHVN